jgi:adenylate cyclase
MPQGVERRLAAILAADVAAYSRLMGADEEGTLARLRAHRRELVDPKVREHHGRIVKTTGDGLLVEFASVVDAVRCAAEIQRAMLDREAKEAEDGHIRFRIGINLGDIIVEDADIFGDGVNVAARLEALAKPGGLCVSRVVRDQVRDRLPYAFADMGDQTVKNIARPVRAYALNPDAVALLPPVTAAIAEPTPRATARPKRQFAIAGITAAVILTASAASWWVWSQHGQQTLLSTDGNQTKPASQLSIVVLPFENLSNEPNQEYFVDGVTDDLTTDLSRIDGSFVISRTTAFTYKGKPVDLKQIGRDLGVRYVLEGSVRRLGDQVHVNVQLIDAASEAHVWAEQFDTDRANLAQAQSEITGRLANALHVVLVRDAARRLEEAKGTAPDVQDLIMRGWAWYYRSASRENRERARQAFERALAIDSHSAAAQIGLAKALVVGILDGWSQSPSLDEIRAEQLLNEALDSDPDSSIAHWTKGVLRRIQNRLAESRAELEQAISLDRNSAEAYFQLGVTSLLSGDPQAAVAPIEKAIRLSPHDPLTGIYVWYLGTCRVFLGDNPEGLDLLRNAVAAKPELYFTHLWLGGALGIGDRLDEAKAEIDRSLKTNPAFSSLDKIRLLRPYGNAKYWSLFDNTIAAGLRRAGFPEK